MAAKLLSLRLPFRRVVDKDVTPVTRMQEEFHRLVKAVDGTPDPRPLNNRAIGLAGGINVLGVAAKKVGASLVDSGAS